MEDLKIATRLESVLNWTAERNTISTVCDFYKEIVNEKQWHKKIQQLLASNDLNQGFPPFLLLIPLCQVRAFLVTPKKF